MYKGSLLFILLFCFSFLSGQNPVSTDSSRTTKEKEERPAPEPFILKPIIGLGTGMFSFYGDLYRKNFVNPQVSRIGYDLSVTQKLNSSLNMSFYVLFGKLGANERQPTRNLNFESQIRVGGVHLEYTFDNFLNPGRNISPYIALGFESFEFLTKTDLFDQYGNRYHYWSDGSIRNVDQNSSEAGTAVIIKRDYTYESDVRELNLDGFGKYPERSFAVPVGVGALMHLSPRMDFKIGTTFHFGLTDYIDGVTENSIGERKGNSRNDNFLMSSFSVRYDLVRERKGADTIIEEDFSDEGIYAIDTEDGDRDGVLDINDSCQFTPTGVVVDLKGCPLDIDLDLVSDYKDKETPSPNPLTDTEGVALTDSSIQRMYDFYNDTLGTMFMVTEIIEPAGRPKKKDGEEYTVLIGTYKGALSNEVMTQFLSIPDIGSTLTPDSATAYTAGSFTSKQSAEKRLAKIQQQGFKNAKVVRRKGNMFFDPETVLATADPKNQTDPQKGNDTTAGQQGKDQKDTVGSLKDGIEGKDVTSGGDTSDITNAGDRDKLVFRVQLGAYRKRLSKNVFQDSKNLLEVKTDDGLYKYTSGSFSTFDEAAKHKVEMLQKYPGAFIVAYKNGKRVALTDAGATPAKPMKPEDLEENGQPQNVINKDLVYFKVQVGAFMNEPPAEMQAKFEKLKTLEKSKTTAGLTRFTSGSFKTFEEAKAHRDKLRAQGIADAFIIAFFKEELINVQEAIELKK